MYSSQVSIAPLVIPPASGRVEASFGGFLLGSAHLRLHNDLDRVLDAILGLADRGRKLLEWKGVGVNLGRVETLLPHIGFCAVRRALALAANAVDVDIVTHDMRDIDRHFLVRKGRETDAAAAIDHADRIVDGACCSRA